MKYESLHVVRSDGIAEVVITRDDVRNALAPEVRQELLSCFEELGAASDVRALVLTGEGRSFSSGGSIRRFREQSQSSPSEVRAELDEVIRLFEAVPRLGKPVVAAVNGHALGGGCGLAMSCDITIASDRATFGFPEITRGFVPALVSVPCLRRLPLKKATELLLLGETISAAEAVEAGLANRVVPHDELLLAAREVARRLAGFSAEAIRNLKELIFTMSRSRDEEAALLAAREVSTLMRFSTDFRAGTEAFFSKDLKS